MEKIKGLFGKKTLYFICILAFNYVEFLRATGNGDVWKMAANCTGFVMMVIIFSNYEIKSFFNIINYIYTAVCIMAMVAVYFHWKQHMGEYYLGQVETAIMNIWWIGLMLRHLFRQVFITKQMTVRIGIIGWLWVIMVAWCVLGKSGMLWPLWFFLMFGMFYMTKFSKTDWETLTNALINGTICSFFAIQGYAYLFRPYDRVRYMGAYTNCNAMALYFVIVYVFILIKLHQLHMNKAKAGWKLFYFIGAGGLLSFQFLTVCRTAWMTSGIVTIVFGYWVLRNHWGESWRKILMKGCLLALCAILTFLPVFYSVRYIPTIHPHPIWHMDDEYGMSRIHSWDPADSEKYIELDEFLEVALGRISSLFRVVSVNMPFTLKAHAQEEITYVDNTSTSGMDSSIKVRFELWKAYLKETTLLGHPAGSENFAWKSNGKYIWHAQNVWVQFTYTYGLPVGILFAVVTTMLLFTTYKKGKVCENVYGIIPFMLCLSFFLFGTAEVVWNPGQYILTLFFFGLHPQFLQDNETRIIANK